MLLPGGKRRRRERDAIPPGACARAPPARPLRQSLAGGARLPADGAGHRHVRGHAHGDPLHHPAPAGRRGRLLPQRVRAGGDPALARAPRDQPLLHRAARPACAARRAQRGVDADVLRRPVADAAGASHRPLLHRAPLHRTPQRALSRRGIPLAALDRDPVRLPRRPRHPASRHPGARHRRAAGDRLLALVEHGHHRHQDPRPHRVRASPSPPTSPC